MAENQVGRRRTSAELTYEQYADCIAKYLCQELQLDECDTAIIFSNGSRFPAGIHWPDHLTHRDSSAHIIDCQIDIPSYGHHEYSKIAANNKETITSFVHRETASIFVNGRCAFISCSFAVSPDLEDRSVENLLSPEYKEYAARDEARGWSSWSDLFPCALISSLLRGEAKGAVLVPRVLLRSTRYSEVRAALLHSGHLDKVIYLPFYSISHPEVIDAALLIFDSKSDPERKIHFGGLEFNEPQSIQSFINQIEFGNSHRASEFQDVEWDIDLASAQHLDLVSPQRATLQDQFDANVVKPVTSFTTRTLRREIESKAPAIHIPGSPFNARILSPASFTDTGTLLPLELELKSRAGRFKRTSDLLVPVGRVINQDYFLHPGDVLFSRTNTNSQAFLVPEINGSLDYSVFLASESFIAMHPSKPEQGPLICSLLRSPLVEIQLRGLKRSGISGAITPKELLRILVPKIKEEQLNRVIELSRAVSEHKKKAEEALHGLWAAEDEFDKVVNQLEEESQRTA